MAKRPPFLGSKTGPVLGSVSGWNIKSKNTNPETDPKKIASFWTPKRGPFCHLILRILMQFFCGIFRLVSATGVPFLHACWLRLAHGLSAARQQQFNGPVQSWHSGGQWKRPCLMPWFWAPVRGPNCLLLLKSCGQSWATWWPCERTCTLKYIRGQIAETKNASIKGFKTGPWHVAKSHIPLCAWALWRHHTTSVNSCQSLPANGPSMKATEPLKVDLLAKQTCSAVDQRNIYWLRDCAQISYHFQPPNQDPISKTFKTTTSTRISKRLSRYIDKIMEATEQLSEIAKNQNQTLLSCVVERLLSCPSHLSQSTKQLRLEKLLSCSSHLSQPTKQFRYIEKTRGATEQLSEIRKKEN